MTERARGALAGHALARRQHPDPRFHSFGEPAPVVVLTVVQASKARFF